MEYKTAEARKKWPVDVAACIARLEDHANWTREENMHYLAFRDRCGNTVTFWTAGSLDLYAHGKVSIRLEWSCPLWRVMTRFFARQYGMRGLSKMLPPSPKEIALHAVVNECRAMGFVGGAP
jgi:hypothetical protein